MSIRWMAVQYVGDTLRLPVVNEGDMDKPFGSSVVDREISRIVVNPFSDNPQTFVRESDYEKLFEYVTKLEMAVISLDSDNYELRNDVKDINFFVEDNKKLRELLADLAICACGKYCHGCPHQYDGCDRDERLRELGIEVDK